MPEAAVDEHRDTRRAEDDISTALEVRLWSVVQPVPQPTPMEC
jgi:hypothetical protein